jgi:ATP-binding cassette, subfamily B, bacterial
MSLAEFTVTDVIPGDRRSSFRWVLSHAARNKWAMFWMFSGAFGNAALAAAIPIFIGYAFNAISAPTSAPNYQVLTWAALWIFITQIIRSVWQLARNFNAELLGQRLERDSRAELYASLLGKSMTFHSLRPVGEVMARATNDVRELGLMLNPGINLIVGSANFLFMPLFLAPTYHPQLILTPVLFFISYWLALRQYMNELRPVTETVRRKFGVMNAGRVKSSRALSRCCCWR